MNDVCGEVGQCGVRASRGAVLPLGRALLLAVAVSILPWPSLARAAEPPAPPASFTEVAAGALAASFVVRTSAAAWPAEGSLSVQDTVDTDEIEEDGWEPSDPISALRNRTLGAGVVIDPRGIALTSARVVLRARDFEVAMMDGTAVAATVVGLDLRSDVAVLKLEGRGTFFPHLPLGHSERVRIGDWVISVGAPLGLDGTVVAGVITAVPGAVNTAAFGHYIQTDAMMARGNAGGPLVDMNGTVVGLGAPVGDGGSAYAIPSNTLRRISRELIDKGRVGRPWLGTTTQSLTPRLARALGASDHPGALIADVVPNGPAATSGVRPGDIVVDIGTTPILSRLEFERAMSGFVPGDIVTLKLFRAGVARTVTTTVGEDPENAPPGRERVLAKRRLGIEVGPINPTAGAVARDIALWSSAAQAGIRPGDVIREVDGRPVRSPADFQAIATAITPGAPVLMRVQRGDVVLYVVVTATR
jgi:serine protease Do